MLTPFRMAMKRFVLLLAATFIASSASAQIYQWKDENGRTVISDKPPVGQVRAQRKGEAGIQGPAAAPKSVAEQEMDFRKRQKEAQEKTAKSEKEQAAQAEKQEYCANMRRQLMSLESGERIARRDDNGERYFLEDTQREQEIAKLRQAMQTTCN